MSCKEAALRSQDSELTRLKAELLEAQRSTSDTEVRLQLLSESVQLYKQKYQTCVSKMAELESREDDRKQSRAQVFQRPRVLNVSKFNQELNHPQAVYFRLKGRGHF